MRSTDAGDRARPGTGPVRARRRRACGAALLAAAVMVGCGGGSSDSLGTGDATSSTGVPATGGPSGAIAPATRTGTVTTSNGSYRVDLSVGPRGTAASTSPCAPTVPAGSVALPVVVTVVNASADEAVPFPPLRVELVNGGSPAEVLVQDPSGTCTFTPRVPALEPGGTVSFSGATLPMADTAAPGSAGAVQVGISESDFSVSVPVP